jgi:hypothetical protein
MTGFIPVGRGHDGVHTRRREIRRVHTSRRGHDGVHTIRDGYLSVSAPNISPPLVLEHF